MAVVVNDDGEQVRIQLSTKDTDLEFPQKPGPILVSTELTRYPLSKLVNTLLSAGTQTAFDFLVNSQTLLTTTLSSYLQSHGLSTETTLHLEYTRALPPPRHSASFRHDDWIGAVDVLSGTSPASTANLGTSIPPLSGAERIASGGFDGIVRVWDSSGNTIATSEGAMPPDAHGNRRLEDGRHPAVHGVRWLSPTRLVAGGEFGYLKVLSLQAPDMPEAQGSLSETMQLHGHEAFVTALDVNPGNQTILSASSDGTARLWTADPRHESVPAPDADLLPRANDSSASKRRRTNPALRNQLIQHFGALATLDHTTAASTSPINPVNAAIFSPTQPAIAAYTVSRGGAVRVWDLLQPAAVITRSLGAEHDLRGLCALARLSLVATGASRDILMVDVREDARRTVTLRLRGHRGIVSALAAQPQPNGSASNGDTQTSGAPAGDFGLCSSAFDGTVRVWDVRNTRGPLDSTAQNESGGRTDEDGANRNGLGGLMVADARFVIPRRDENGREVAVKGDGRDTRLFDVCWDAIIGIVSGGMDKNVQIDSVGSGVVVA